MPFALADLPNLSGKRAVITGATGGLGYETALALAGAGASVTVTGRNDKKGADAIRNIRAAHPRADVTYASLDLGSLDAIAAFAADFARTSDRLDILVNNAGVMEPPTRQQTADGFELQFGTNHLAHFALTGRLLPLLKGGRVVSVSSISHRTGDIDFDDLQSTREYRSGRAYGQSKIANLLFAFELARRSQRAGWGVTSIAAHPGVSRTDLIANGMASEGGLIAIVVPALIRIFGQPAADGALPQIYAAAHPAAKAGAYYGPTRFMEVSGPVGTARPSARAQDTALAARLWTVSEQLTGVTFPPLGGMA